MKRSRFFVLAVAATAMNALHADESTLTIVPGIDLAFKNNSYSVPAVDIDLKFKVSFATLVPSLTLAYGRFYGTVNYDFTIAKSEEYITGSVSEPGFLTTNYSRRDATATFGYRLYDKLGLFAGYTQGKGTGLFWGHDGAGAAFAATRIYRENGYFVGASYSQPVREKDMLSASLAYGSLNGLLTAKNETSIGEITSKAPGFSLNLAWTHATSTTLSYRVGVKYTAYTFNGEEYRENGVVTPITRALDYYERITTYYIGVVDYF